MGLAACSVVVVAVLFGGGRFLAVALPRVGPLSDGVVKVPAKEAMID